MQFRALVPHLHTVLGDPEVTANMYCNFAYLKLGRFRDLQYIFAVTSGSPSAYIRLPGVTAMSVFV